MPSPPSSDLCELLGPGADAAVGDLQRTVQRLLGRLAARYRLARSHFEDLTQEVLTACVEQAGKIQRGEAAPLKNRDAWLCRVTHNAVLGLGRRQQRRPQDDAGWPEGFEPPAPRGMDQAERLALRRALALLDEKCRRLLILRDVLGEVRQEIAARLGVSSNTVGVRLHRCRRRLLEIFQGAG